jgi:hypothetical protein
MSGRRTAASRARPAVARLLVAIVALVVAACTNSGGRPGY